MEWGVSAYPRGSPLSSPGWPAPRSWTRPDRLKTHGLLRVSLGDSRPTGLHPPLGTGLTNTGVKDRVTDTHRGQSSKHLLGKVGNKTIIVGPRNSRWNEQQEREGRSDGGTLPEEEKERSSQRSRQ